MANIQTRPGFWRRLFGWFGRHKIIAVLLVLVLGVGGYLEVSDLILQAQVRAERARFMSANEFIDNTVGAESEVGTPETVRDASCSYTSNGAVFATRFLGCSTGVDVVYVNLSKSDGEKLADQARAVLTRKGAILVENKGGYSENDIGVYIFESHGIRCVISSTYYDSTVPDYKRYDHAPKTGTALLTHIGCAGAAKAKYFPLVNN